MQQIYREKKNNSTKNIFRYIAFVPNITLSFLGA